MRSFWILPVSLRGEPTSAGLNPVPLSDGSQDDNPWAPMDLASVDSFATIEVIHDNEIVRSGAEDFQQGVLQ